MRADAERNRAAILAAAGRLICEEGLDRVSMDDIAAAAEVGKGTLFRRFTDREGLIRALIDDRTEQWWGRVRARAGDTTVPARDRALVFVDELFELAIVQLPPLMRAESDSCQADTWSPWRKLLAELITEVRPEADGEFLALAIFASMRPEIADVMPPDRHRAGVLALTASSLDSSRRE